MIEAYAGAGRFLGQRVEQPLGYDAGLLVRVPREGVVEGVRGWDVWHCYEASFLQDGGLPVRGMLKVVYPSTSAYIVESKSLKLYLNSLNGERLGVSREEGVERYVSIVEGDLGALLEVPVRVGWHRWDRRVGGAMGFPFNGFCEPYEDRFPGGLLCEGLGAIAYRRVEGESDYRFCTNLLRSLCPVTGQPDWGSLYVELRGGVHPDSDSLLRYVVGLRGEREFHERIADVLMGELVRVSRPERLRLGCFYLRRGGIDISPYREYGYDGGEELDFVKADILTVGAAFQ